MTEIAEIAENMSGALLGTVWCETSLFRVTEIVVVRIWPLHLRGIQGKWRDRKSVV